MSRFGKTILKWKEPKIISKIKDRNLSLMNRIWKKQSVPFFSGTILFFILILLESKFPNTFLQLIYDLLLSSGMGIFFVIIYGLLGLTSP